MCSSADSANVSGMDSLCEAFYSREKLCSVAICDISQSGFLASCEAHFANEHICSITACEVDTNSQSGTLPAEAAWLTNGTGLPSLHNGLCSQPRSGQHFTVFCEAAARCVTFGAVLAIANLARCMPSPHHPITLVGAGPLAQFASNVWGHCKDALFGDLLMVKGIHLLVAGK